MDDQRGHSSWSSSGFRPYLKETHVYSQAGRFFWPLVPSRDSLALLFSDLAIHRLRYSLPSTPDGSRAVIFVILARSGYKANYCT